LHPEPERSPTLIGLTHIFANASVDRGKSLAREHRDTLIAARTLLQQAWILFNQVAPVPVAHHKIKISFFQQVVFNSGHH